MPDRALELARLSRWSRPIRPDVVRVLPIEQILSQDNAASAPDRYALDLSGVLGRRSSGMSTLAERCRRECDFKDAQYRQHACPCHGNTSGELFYRDGTTQLHANRDRSLSRVRSIGLLKRSQNIHSLGRVKGRGAAFQVTRGVKPLGACHGRRELRSELRLFPFYGSDRGLPVQLRRRRLRRHQSCHRIAG